MTRGESGGWGERSKKSCQPSRLLNGAGRGRSAVPSLSERAERHGQSEPARCGRSHGSAERTEAAKQVCGVAVTCTTPTAAARVWLTVRVFSPAPETQFRALLQSPLSATTAGNSAVAYCTRDLPARTRIVPSVSDLTGRRSVAVSPLSSARRSLGSDVTPHAPRQVRAF